jgi:hypothetical protein
MVRLFLRREITAVRSWIWLELPIDSASNDLAPRRLAAMVIRLLPAFVDPLDATGADETSTSLVPFARGAIAVQVNGESDVARPGDTYAWAESERGGGNRIYGTPVEDSDEGDASSETGRSAWEYVSGSVWSPPIERTAVSHYLKYSKIFRAWTGLLINVYA